MADLTNKFLENVPGRYSDDCAEIISGLFQSRMILFVIFSRSLWPEYPRV